MTPNDYLPLPPASLFYTVSYHDVDRFNVTTQKWRKAGRLHRITVFANVAGTMIEIARREEPA